MPCDETSMEDDQFLNPFNGSLENRVTCFGFVGEECLVEGEIGDHRCFGLGLMKYLKLAGPWR